MNNKLKTCVSVIAITAINSAAVLVGVKIGNIVCKGIDKVFDKVSKEDDDE